MSTNNSIHFQYAATLDESQSSACRFFGISDDGGVATVIAKNGTAYSYCLDEQMDLEDFNRVVKNSVGKFWVNVLKKLPLIREVKDANYKLGVASDYWHDANAPEVKKSRKKWKINSESSFAF